MAIKIDQYGHVLDFGDVKAHDRQIALTLARQHEANRAKSAAVTGRLSSAGGVAQIQEFLAVPSFVDTDVSASLGGTKATLDASLALVNDALAALFVDLNAIAVTLSIPQVTYAGGGTAASPIAAITGAGVAAATSATAANMNPIRDQINTNMHTAGGLYNKVARATGWDAVKIETTGERQPPPDDYGKGSTVAVGGTTVVTSGSGVAFGAESPFTNPTPAITEDSGTFAATGVTKVALDLALDTWRNNVETLAKRLSLLTNTVAALTDSSTGTVGLSVGINDTAFANEAASGSDLADKTTTDAEMADIRNALASLWAKANEVSAGSGGSQRTYDGAGTVGTTLAAIGAVTGAATGVQATEMNVFRVETNEAADALAEFVNEVARVALVAEVSRAVVTSPFPFDNPVNPQQQASDLNDTTRAQSRHTTFQQDPSPGATIPVSGGTAADPGVKKAAADAAFTVLKNSVATLNAKLDEIRAAVHGPQVLIV